MVEAVDVHLIDGTFELFRAYFAVPKTTGPAATRSARRGACYAASRPGWPAVKSRTWRAPSTTSSSRFRNELFDGYKTGDGIDPDLYAQFELAERATRALGI